MGCQESSFEINFPDYILNRGQEYLAAVYTANNIDVVRTGFEYFFNAAEILAFCSYHLESDNFVLKILAFAQGSSFFDWDLYRLSPQLGDLLGRIQSTKFHHRESG